MDPLGPAAPKEEQETWATGLKRLDQHPFYGSALWWIRQSASGAEWSTDLPTTAFDPSVPSEASPLLASMFFSRGVRHGQQGDSAAEIADYTRAIDLPGAPPEQVAKALGNRGWMRYEAREFPAFLADTQAALALNPEPSLQFNLMLAWLALDEADKAGAVVRATLVNNCPKTAKDRERPRKGRSARGDEDMASA